MAGRTTPQASRRRRSLRVLLVGPESIVGLGIRRALERQSGFEVVADSDSPEGALPLLGAAHPDVIVIDLRLLEPDAAEATRRLTAEAEDAAIVVVGGDANAGTILGAIEMGATAHVTEGAEPSELAWAIERAARGEDPLKEELAADPELVERIVDAMREGAGRVEERPPAPLTERELEILAAAARGLKNREIAAEFGIGEQTVKNHMSIILRQLGVRNRTLAVTRAVASGWIKPGEVRPRSRPRSSPTR